MVCGFGPKSAAKTGGFLKLDLWSIPRSLECSGLVGTLGHPFGVGNCPVGRDPRFMRHTLFKLAAYIQLGAVALTGCAPTQPYFLRERADLVHYLETAQEIEYPDLESNPLAGST
jgi:hypothetical protein